MGQGASNGLRLIDLLERSTSGLTDEELAMFRTRLLMEIPSLIKRVSQEVKAGELDPKALRQSYKWLRESDENE